MKHHAIVTTSLIVSIVSSGIGFWLGVREGAGVESLISLPPRAFISLRNIEWIHAGKPEKAFGFLESDIDNALLWATDLDNHPLRPFLEPIWGFPVWDYGKFLARLADYRKTHKSPTNAELLSAEPIGPSESAESRKTLIDGAKEVDAIIAAAVTKYASKPEK